ncbi:hypothetical protein PR202_ga20954 [Eleusine coracana subsp. coracana]|uniref:Uncharacterized protein n=1 Tax=Eleusine coracana subsp. coracana TaxID=191504 RepID=A0AAV5CZK9_ELECO|nr:hypothetical protein PR202_ga20954 [Eleusine coracana subsp. coracana]
MPDIEAAVARTATTAAPPQVPAPARAAGCRAAVAATVADVIIYCCLGAMWASHAAGALVVFARYAVGWSWTAYAALVVRVAREVFLGALVSTALLCPLTIPVLLLRIYRRQTEFPERMILVRDPNLFPVISNFRFPGAILSVGCANFVPAGGRRSILQVQGVYTTVQVHGQQRPAPRGRRQGAGYGLVLLVIFVFFSMSMLVGLLLQERLPTSVCWEDRISMPALISDSGSVAMIMFIVIPYVLVQVRDLPK